MFPKAFKGKESGDRHSIARPEVDGIELLSQQVSSPLARVFQPKWWAARKHRVVAAALGSVACGANLRTATNK
jgi:hypothetical protein